MQGVCTHGRERGPCCADATITWCIVLFLSTIFFNWVKPFTPGCKSFFTLVRNTRLICLENCAPQELESVCGQSSGTRDIETGYMKQERRGNEK